MALIRNFGELTVKVGRSRQLGTLQFRQWHREGGFSAFNVREYIQEVQIAPPKICGFCRAVEFRVSPRCDVYFKGASHLL